MCTNIPYILYLKSVNQYPPPPTTWPIISSYTKKLIKLTLIIDLLTSTLKQYSNDPVDNYFIL